MSEWRVLVEENVGRFDRKEWRISDIYEVDGGREEARSIAYELAMRHQPKHPGVEADRAVYRINEDMWLTMVIGATSRFHYRVTVAELFARASTAKE
ncbi:hypothetical protein GCM10009555_088620 [Acrocarpospora macrocephala]|uniref:Uncharacterized protein n=2 Tax=Acrocarpospora TaxID=90974 RepID=A0A5M3XP37_9ACTN|nr:MULTISPECIES: hypothetical protein [Acrocarpospora]GES14075.1 hypothetical protein Amac_076720 [Acrocarpospora macrocephala]GES22506.1 hypothetical protein Aple_054040 [Acrocarpospora pleiomorpha]